MLLAPFLWIFCEFDEKVLDNSFREVRNGLYDIERGRREVGRDTS